MVKGNLAENVLEILLLIKIWNSYSNKCCQSYVAHKNYEIHIKASISVLKLKEIKQKMLPTTYCL